MSWGYRQSLTLNPNPSTPLKLPLQTASYCQKPQTTNNRFAYYDIEYRKSVTHSPESPCAAFRASQCPMIYSEGHRTRAER